LLRLRAVLIVAAVLVGYALLVPTIPFQRYYSGDFTSESMIQSLGCRSGTYSFQTQAPSGATPGPNGASTFGVAGAESISAWVFGTGAVTIGWCSGTPFTVRGYPDLMLLDGLASVALALSLFLFVQSQRVQKTRPSLPVHK
jgi:hypothetical protein